MTIKENLQFVQTETDRYLRSLVPDAPQSLYDPVRYIIGAGGKRLRPALTRLCSLSDPNANWLPAAAAVEMLHTFTLVHDDIMDNAATRRGLATVHEKWDVNTAILSGDVMIALAEESLARGEYAHASAMMREFSAGFRSVCEGQAYDKEFETRGDISAEDYFHMIDLKSAKLIEMAAVLGAYAAGGSNVEPMRRFAHHLGLAFQLRDDLLDLTASDDFGKTIGGDIVEGKRTFLFIRAHAAATTSADRALMEKIAARRASFGDIPSVREAFVRLGAVAETEARIASHTTEATNAVKELEHEGQRNALLSFADYLLTRST
jgi:geranylgeranyl diphosphate synthase type II